MLQYLVSFSIFFSIFFQREMPSAECATGPEPEWVKKYTFAKEPVPVKPSQAFYQSLLYDYQINWEEKTWYCHIVVKVLNQAAAEGFTQIPIDFDPSYQQVIVHGIRVLRNGEFLDRLEKARHAVIQREEALSDQLYDGRQTLIYFLNDVRAGDIVEYSFSITGEHHVWPSIFNDLIVLQEKETIEKISYRLLMHPDNCLLIKPFNTTISPQIADLSSTLREYAWEIEETQALPCEKETPSWYNPAAEIQLGQLKSWQEAAQKLLRLYALPNDLETNPSPEMVSLVEKWQEAAPDDIQRATLALRFVQDEVKYLGFEAGKGSWIGADPRLVLEQRFGDCKEKSALLQALLKRMFIHSTLVCVDSKNGKRLPEMLPTLSFSHIILKIEIDNVAYWVDPTLTRQGGSLQDTFFPEYHWGLELAKETTGLTPLPKLALARTCEINTSISLTSMDSANVKIQRIFFGHSADAERESLDLKGYKHFSQGYFERAQRHYKGATLLSDISISDDRKQNRFILSESYRITTRPRAGKKLLNAASIILNGYLNSILSPERTSPYALDYPLWIKEKIHIENPFCHWDAESESQNMEHESIHYSYSMKKEGHVADFEFELKNLKDHVPASAVRKYWDIMCEIEPNPSLVLNVAPLH